MDDGAHNDIRQDIKCHTGAMWQLKLFFFALNLLPSKRAKKWEIYFATFSSCAQSLHTFCGVTSIDKAFHSASRSFPSLSFYSSLIVQVVAGLPLNICLPRNVKHSEIGFDELRCQVINLSVAVRCQQNLCESLPWLVLGGKKTHFLKDIFLYFLMNIDNIEFSKGGLDRHLS